MVKKARKKSQSIQKERPVASASPTTILQNLKSSDENGGSVVVGSGRKACTHMSKDVDLGKFSSKIDSLESVRCEDCREVAVDRRSAKGKNKSGKKKGAGNLGAKSGSKAIWVCLECAHFSCGGIGLPTIPQCHVAWHSRQHCHPCVIQFDNPQLRWCFSCDSLIPVEKSQNNGEQKDTLLDLVKLFKGELSAGTSVDVDVDVEDVWFGGGNAGNKLVSDNIRSGISDRGYRVRGLSNLGNTCFFNSVMQNLFAIDMLRDYFMKLEGSFGSLTTALKKLFSEKCLDVNSRGAINPKSFFECLCSKAPQFRGRQQHDSHELLRCLLDGLCTEEFEARRFQDSNVESKTSSNHGPTSVDAIFRGQLSSSVCCVECGHSSIVYEPFFDLSLPVPTRKTPPKKPVAVSLPRKPKLPPKKSKKNHLKEGAQKRQPDATSSGCNDPSCSKQSIVPVVEQSVASIDDSSWLDFVETSNASDFLVSFSQNKDTSNTQDDGNKQVIKDDVEQSPGPSDEVPRLDYKEPGKIAADCHSASQDFDKSAAQDFESGTVIQNGMLQNDSDLLSQGGNPNPEPNLELHSSQSNSCEGELPLLVQSSEVLLLPFKEENSTIEGTFTKEDEASTSLAGCEPDGLDFNGFGDLFNEPEMVPDPNMESSLGDVSFQFQATEITETSFVAGNSSDSCPEEVDDSDAPVSVDSCLSHFTKPELLSDKHAWHCENCSKILQGRRRMEVKGGGGLRRSSPGTSMDGVEVRSGNAPLGFNNDSMDLANHLDNGKLDTDMVFTNTDESLPLDKKRLDDRNQNCTKFANCEKGEEIDSEFVNPISNSLGCLKISQGDEVVGLLNHTTEWQTPAVDNYDASIPTSDSCILDIVQAQPQVPQPLSRICDSGENEDEEVDSENVKVMRDATKRILINRVPPILTIHLKRFSQDSRGRLSKLSGPVSFKEAFDLRPYMDPRCGEERDKCEYQLVGVVVHSGTMHSGHYTAYVRGNESQLRNEKLSGESSWYYISDCKVQEVSLAQVLQCEAYILFYEKT